MRHSQNTRARKRHEKENYCIVEISLKKLHYCCDPAGGKEAGPVPGCLKFTTITSVTTKELKLTRKSDQHLPLLRRRFPLPE